MTSLGRQMSKRARLNIPAKEVRLRFGLNTPDDIRSPKAGIFFCFFSSTVHSYGPNSEASDSTLNGNHIFEADIVSALTPSMEPSHATSRHITV